MSFSLLGAKVPVSEFHGAKVPESETSGTKVPGSESSTYGTFVPGSESTWERKFQLPCAVFTVQTAVHVNLCTPTNSTDCDKPQTTALKHQLPRHLAPMTAP